MDLDLAIYGAISADDITRYCGLEQACVDRFNLSDRIEVFIKIRELLLTNQNRV